MVEQAASAVVEDKPSIEKPYETPPDWEPSILAFTCHY